jgi:hypothetical protein
MRFALKDYQVDAVGEVLRNLADACDDWHRKQRPVAFSLTATTGAGKTVMAAAVIEALFDGDADDDFEADPSAVVLWFTDDPSLNEQTRFKLIEASDRIAGSRLVVVENTFNQEKLEPGRVYFLNAQKLSKNSLLVKGAPEAGEHLFATAGTQLPLVDHTVSAGKSRRMSSLSRPDSCTRVGSTTIGAYRVRPSACAIASSKRWTVAEIPHTTGTAGTPLAPLIRRLTVVCFSARSCVVLLRIPRCASSRIM